MLRLLQPGGAPEGSGASGVAELPPTIVHGVCVLPAQKHLESVKVGPGPGMACHEAAHGWHLWLARGWHL
eukprot:5287205-Prymnesium_polylepis.1